MKRLRNFLIWLMLILSMIGLNIHVITAETLNALDMTVFDGPESDELPEGSSLEVHFIDVGQGDAIFVRCDGQTMLIDGGSVSKSSLIYSYLSKYEADHLDYIICTHAHEDHVGGLAGALNYASVDTVMAPVTSYDSEAFNNFAKYVEKQEKEITVPSVGDTFTLGHAFVTVLGPVNNDSDNANNTSIVLRIVHGQNSFLFTGDAELEEEQDLLNANILRENTVLKIGHHGSDTSTSYRFLDTIMPKYAVISVGKDNSYGHPDEATLSKLRDEGAKVYRTDMQGTIICISDGKELNWIVERNADADTLSKLEPAQSQSQTPSVQQTQTAVQQTAPASSGQSYVVNVNTRKFHYPNCSSVSQIKASNRMDYTGDRQDLINQGYQPCKRCNP